MALAEDSESTSCLAQVITQQMNHTEAVPRNNLVYPSSPPTLGTSAPLKKIRLIGTAAQNGWISEQPTSLLEDEMGSQSTVASDVTDDLELPGTKVKEPSIVLQTSIEHEKERKDSVIPSL